jgi:peptide/nickel transport system substrate-binding protein
MTKSFATALFLLVLAGCGGGGDGNARVGTGLPPAGGGGTLDYALPAVPVTLDPLAAGDRASMTVVRQVSEPLVEQLSGPYGQTSAPEPGLALSAKPSHDRTTWTVTLRSGVRFQDGTPFNAASVLANSRRWQSDPTGRALLPHLFAVDAPRPDEVRFLLDEPVPDLASRLSDPRLGIVSPRGAGTGPFQPERAGPGRRTLTRFAGWWGSPKGLGPALDGVTFLVARRPAQRLRLLQQGSVQVADPLGPSGLRLAQSDPLLATVGGPVRGIGLEGSVRGVDSAGSVPVLSGVWLTRLRG